MALFCRRQATDGSVETSQRCYAEEGCKTRAYSRFEGPNEAMYCRHKRTDGFVDFSRPECFAEDCVTVTKCSAGGIKIPVYCWQHVDDKVKHGSCRYSTLDALNPESTAGGQDMSVPENPNPSVLSCETEHGSEGSQAVTRPGKRSISTLNSRSQTTAAAHTKKVRKTKGKLPMSPETGTSYTVKHSQGGKGWCDVKVETPPLL